MVLWEVSTGYVWASPRVNGAPLQRCYTADEWETEGSAGCPPRGWMINYGGPFVSLYPGKHALPQFIHFLCVRDREKHRGCKIEAQWCHQTAADHISPSHSQTRWPLSWELCWCILKNIRNTVSFAGRLVIYRSSRDIMMKLNVKPKCQKASVGPVLQLSSLHNHGRQRGRQLERLSAVLCPVYRPERKTRSRVEIGGRHVDQIR